MITEKKSVILSTAYLPPLQYFAGIAGYNNFYIEKQENYSKQTYRNRCAIGSANGRLDLVIPVKKTGAGKILITDVQIDNNYKWQILHWRAIISAYKNSPFFEYYEHDLHPFYSDSFSNLFAFNTLLTEKLLELLELKVTPLFTEIFVKEYSENTIDKRYSIHPKIEEKIFIPLEYTQVFSSKHGFLPNLSIIDLIFNTGPSAKDFL